MRYMGLTEQEYLFEFDRVNLMYEMPGPPDRKNDKDCWKSGLARRVGRSMRTLLGGRTCLVIGKATAAALGSDLASLEPLAWRTLPTGLSNRCFTVAWVPHTSGRSLYWNNPNNVAALAVFIRDMRRLLGWTT